MDLWLPGVEQVGRELVWLKMDNVRNPCVDESVLCLFCINDLPHVRSYHSFTYHSFVGD